MLVPKVTLVREGSSLQTLPATLLFRRKDGSVWLLTSIKINENNGLEGPKIVQNRGLGGLSVAWDVFGEVWVRISRKILARVRPRWVK